MAELLHQKLCLLVPSDLPQNQKFPQAPALAVNAASRVERQSGWCTMESNLVWWLSQSRCPQTLRMLNYPRVLFTLWITDLLGNWLKSRHSSPSGGGGERNTAMTFGWKMFIDLVFLFWTKRLNSLESVEEGSYPILSQSHMEFLHLLDRENNCWWSLTGVVRGEKKTKVIEVGETKGSESDTREGKSWSSRAVGELRKAPVFGSCPSAHEDGRSAATAGGLSPWPHMRL